MRIVLMGPPGAGKGTQAKRLVDEFGIAHLSSGDIFRAVRASGSDLGERLAKYMDAGELVPDELVVSMMTEAIADNDSAGGIMLDGFPRTVPQAEALDEQLARAGARGILFHHYVWCDKWHAEFTRLKEWAKLPMLRLDSEGHGEMDVVRVRNRVRAFLETFV